MQEQAAPSPEDVAETAVFTAIEAAARLGVHERTIRRAIAQGTLVASRRGNAFSITAEALEHYRQQRQATPPAASGSARGRRHQAPLLALITPEEPARAPVPRPLDTLIGRQAEVAAISQLLTQPGVQLVTLLGPGGVGKTRVAIAVANALGDHFAHGVTFIPLAAVTDPKRVLPTLAHALNLRDSGDRPVAEAIAAALASRELLLVLDNVEQVLAGGDALAGLLSRCPGVRILATSREPLRIPGEHRTQVAPLALPPVGVEATPSAVTACTSVELFLDRARRVQPDLHLSAANLAAIARICQRLDGLPLAIEMAAAWLGVLSPPALLARLDHSLPLLTSAYRNAPDRQRTLRDALAWSYALLSPQEQRVLRTLGIFVGGCSVEAAQQVVATATEPASTVAGYADVLATIAALVDKNLLVRLTTPDGDDRFGMYEVVREFGLDLLESHGERLVVQRAHAAWCRELAVTAGPRVMDGDQVVWLNRLEADHDNVRAALTFALASGDRQLPLAVGAALWEFWYIRGHVAEGLRWLDAAITAAPAGPDVALVQSLIGAGQLAHYIGESDRASAYLTRSLAMARELGDTVGSALSLLELGIIAEDRGLYDEATRRLEASRGLYARLPVSTSGAMTVYHLAVVAYGQGKLAEADALCAEALRMSHAAGSAFGIGAVQTHRGLVLADLGDASAALAALHEALDLYVASQDLEGIARCLANLAVLATTTHQWRAAAHFWGAVATMCDTLGYGFHFPEAPRYAAAEAAAREALGAAYARHLDSGRDWTLGLAVEHARTFRDAAASRTLPEHSSGLTEREREVLTLVAAGRSDREIADALFISRHTATTHVGNILLKLNVATRAAAAARAVQAGYIDTTASGGR